MKEEIILYNLDNAKTPKEKRSAYRHVAVQLEEKGSTWHGAVNFTAIKN